MDLQHYGEKQRVIKLYPQLDRLKASKNLFDAKLINIFQQIITMKLTLAKKLKLVSL